MLAFQVDYPESCLLTLVRQNQACPICLAKKGDFADLQLHRPERTVQNMKREFHIAQDLEGSGNIQMAQEIYQDNGIVNIEV